MKIDKTLPYPYLPGYTGTIDERERIIKQRLRLLLSSLQQLESQYADNKKDIALLAKIEQCQVIVRELLENG